MAPLSRSIAGRVALVTGAASGMGRATAEVLAAEGAMVAACDRDGDGVRMTVQGMAGEHTATTVELRSDEGVRAWVEATARTFGRIDMVVNNAGVSFPATVDGAWEDYDQAWEVTLDVNLRGYTRVVRAALPHLLAAPDGDARIVNVASTEGLGATRYLSAYTASKHGVIGLTRALAVELGPRSITVNAVCPGPIRTGMTAPIPDAAKERFAHRKVPLRRYGEPEEVAHAIVSLLLPAMSYVNGAVLVVDGGMTAKND